MDSTGSRKVHMDLITDYYPHTYYVYLSFRIHIDTHKTPKIHQKNQSVCLQYPVWCCTRKNITYFFPSFFFFFIVPPQETEGERERERENAAVILLTCNIALPFNSSNPVCCCRTFLMWSSTSIARLLSTSTKRNAVMFTLLYLKSSKSNVSMSFSDKHFN